MLLLLVSIALAADPAPAPDPVCPAGQVPTDAGEAGVVCKPPPSGASLLQLEDNAEAVGGIGGLIGGPGAYSGGLGASDAGLGATPPAPSGPLLMIDSGLSLGPPVIIGALDRQLIDTVVIGAGPSFVDCLAPLREANPSPVGKVVVKFVIDKDGGVSKADVKASTLGHDPTAACFVTALKPLRFPKPSGGGIVIASYPMFVGPPEP